MQCFTIIAKSVFSKIFLFILIISSPIFLKPENSYAVNPEWIYTLDNTFISTMADAGDYIWIAVTGRKIYKFDKKNQIIVDSTKGKNFLYVQEIEFDSEDNLWFAGGYVYKYDGDSVIIYRPQITGMSENCSSLEIDAKGNIWFGSDKEIGKYDGTKWTIYNSQNSDLPKYPDGSTPVFSMDIDKDNNLWAIIGGLGIVKYNGADWKLFNETNSKLPTNLLTYLKFDKTGNLWLSSYKNGLIKYDGTDWTIYDSTNSPLPYNQIGKIAVDSSNNIWIGSSESKALGLIKFDGENWTIFNKANSNIHADYIREIVIDKYDNKWLAVSDDVIGLNIFREGGVVLTSIIENLNISNDLLFSPNPAQDFLNFRGDAFLGCNFKIYDILGQELLNGIISDNMINVCNLNSGTYFIEIIKDKDFKYSKFIKN